MNKYMLFKIIIIIIIFIESKTGQNRRVFRSVL
jgi:hypothetical protein